MGKQSSEIEKSKERKMPDSASFENLINSHRRDIGIKELEHDDKLCPFAKQRVEKLFTVDWKNLGHYEFEIDADASGLLGRALLENISEGPNENMQLEGLLGSKSHREAIESKDNVYTCVATKDYLVVQVFAQAYQNKQQPIMK